MFLVIIHGLGNMTVCHVTPPGDEVIMVLHLAQPLENNLLLAFKPVYLVRYLSINGLANNSLFRFFILHFILVISNYFRVKGFSIFELMFFFFNE